ncbi:sensor histidine kinase [Streptomyces liangshanensis]|uniref:histidine kinase n=1 Tax=Streptomyces liangshanensis TaxID=2717324 RepID=A0A6G9GZ50_9ACTN|nr:HAMP domain-containing sensor histidine kinase [Streptomyces liangshanensis]QIQ03261.1 HAMP domain-containing protein [Streptomyces liangshanensis]
MSSQEGTASGQPSAPPRSRRRRIVVLLERWPFGRKLHLLVLVPVLVVTGMLTYVVQDKMAQARAASDSAALVRRSVSVATLVDDLQSEHRQALLLSVRHQAAESGAGEPSSIPYLQAQQRVDTQAGVVRETFGSLLPAAENEAIATIGGLTDLRQLIQRGYIPADNIDPTYSNLVEQLISGLGLGDSTTASRGSPEARLDALLGADAAHAAFETSVFGAQTGDSNALIEFLRAIGDHRSYDDRAARFKALSSEAQGALLDGIERASARKSIEDQFNALQVDPSSLQAQTPEELRTAIGLALKAEPVYAQQAEDRLKITHTLIYQVAAQADAASDTEWRHTFVLLGSAVVALLGWLVFSFLVRRSVARPVRILTAAARQVADATGKELARVADDESAETGPPRLREIPVPVRDEIGALAEAFNQVQSTASALLERQITVRANVEQMFGNIGHRVSNLASRQLDLIEGLEQAQTDPATLRPLYQIDHIATRLRRNAESLQVIAGKRQAAEDVDAPRPTGLTDVLRGALSTIGGYERVSLRPSAEVVVVPAAVNDLTLMLAELLQNGVFFSPTHTTVDVAVQVRLPAEGAVIEIIDHGLGMPAEQLAEENARLLRRERLDLAPTHVLGLFVVGRIARRFGIGVELSRTPGEGVTSTVTIPASLLLAADSVPAPPAPTVPYTPAPAPRTTPLPRPAQVSPTPSGSGLPQRVTRAAAGADGDTGEGTDANPSTDASTDASADTNAGAGTDAPPGTGKAGVTGAAADADADHPRTDDPRHDRGADSAGREHARDAGDAPAAGHGQHPDDEPRPLRRRVRGATLAPAAPRTTAAVSPARHPADAAEVRDELEDLEAATERARRDSARDRTAPGPQVSLTPEGPGNDGRLHDRPGDGRGAR